MAARERPTVKIKTRGKLWEKAAGIKFGVVFDTFVSSFSFLRRVFTRSISSLSLSRVPSSSFFPERKGSLYPCARPVFIIGREPIAFRLLYNRGCKWWPYPLLLRFLLRLFPAEKSSRAILGGLGLLTATGRNNKMQICRVF